jgi:crotonobetainyl-CoA:carnitine CoA-transferase CaiB-like acyl-CoA transferase
MWITGPIDGPPVAIDAPVIAHLQSVCNGIAALSETVGTRVDLDVAPTLTQRAAERKFTRQGQASANRSCRIVRCADGWIAWNLPRDTDIELLPALIGGQIVGNPWVAIDRFSKHLPAINVVERAQLLGIATAALDAETPRDSPGPPAIDLVKMGESSEMPRSEIAQVVDFSAMWAGPLCSHILGRSGARVLKIEDPARPDGARVGDKLMYRRLHEGHGLASISFSTIDGRREVQRLIRSADVVIESSRPRALGQMGLTPESFLSERSGRSWISITGYGRNGDRSNYVAFGDDAAVSAGLVGWSDPDTPVFCADAIADPIGGLFAAFGGLASIASGGGFLVNVSLSGASAHVREGAGCEGSHRVEQDSEGYWVAHHDDLAQPVLSPAEVASARV